MKFVLLALASSFVQLAFATDIHDLTGTWKEVGNRCAGEVSYTPRDPGSDKFFTIQGSTYFHRVEFNDRNGCKFVESAGTLNPVANGAKIDVTPTPSAAINCPFKDGSGSMNDDFALTPAPQTITLYIDRVAGANHMIISHDSAWTDSNCPDGWRERVYQLQ